MYYIMLVTTRPGSVFTDLSLIFNTAPQRQRGKDVYWYGRVEGAVANNNFNYTISIYSRFLPEIFPRVLLNIRH